MKTNNLPTNNSNAGFKLPEDYFKTLEDQLMVQTQLPDTASNFGFNIPESYFNTVESKILNQTVTKKGAIVKLFTNRNTQFYSGIAATLILFFGLAFAFNFNTTKSSEIQLSELEQFLLNTDLDDSSLEVLIKDTEAFEAELFNQNLNNIVLESYINQHIDNRKP